MPKETFHNLPKEKREMIEQAAIDEFAKLSFEKASINRIVKRCGIAKGSFYQYFKDKKDLYLHVISLIGQEKIKYLSPVLQNPEQLDFFTLIRELYVSGLRFATSNVKLANIGNEIVKNLSSPMYRELLGESLPKSYDVYEELIKNAMQRGEVRKDIDIKYTGYLLTTMTVSNFEYWMQTHNHAFDIKEYTESIMEIVDKQIEFIKHGIGKKERGEK